MSIPWFVLSQAITPKRSRPNHLWNSAFQFCCALSRLHEESNQHWHWLETRDTQSRLSGPLERYPRMDFVLAQSMRYIGMIVKLSYRLIKVQTSAIVCGTGYATLSPRFKMCTWSVFPRPLELVQSSNQSGNGGSHFICQDTPLSFKFAHAHHTLIKKLDACKSLSIHKVPIPDLWALPSRWCGLIFEERIGSTTTGTIGKFLFFWIMFVF